MATSFFSSLPSDISLDNSSTSVSGTTVETSRAQGTPSISPTQTPFDASSTLASESIINTVAPSPTTSSSASGRDAREQTSPVYLFIFAIALGVLVILSITIVIRSFLLRRRLIALHGTDLRHHRDAGLMSILGFGLDLQRPDVTNTAPRKRRKNYGPKPVLTEVWTLPGKTEASGSWDDWIPFASSIVISSIKPMPTSESSPTADHLLKESAFTSNDSAKLLDSLLSLRASQHQVKGTSFAPVEHPRREQPTPTPTATTIALSNNFNFPSHIFSMSRRPSAQQNTASSHTGGIERTSPHPEHPTLPAHALTLTPDNINGRNSVPEEKITGTTGLETDIGFLVRMPDSRRRFYTGRNLGTEIVNEIRTADESAGLWEIGLVQSVPVWTGIGKTQLL